MTIGRLVFFMQALVDVRAYTFPPAAGGAGLAGIAVNDGYVGSHRLNSHGQQRHSIHLPNTAMDNPMAIPMKPEITNA
jgi:hypothetical protein